MFPPYLSLSITECENMEVKAHILPFIYLYLACEKKEKKASLLLWQWQIHKLVVL